VTEAEFSKTLLNHWRRLGYFVQRVETGQITRGVPDVFVANKRGDLWVELKSVKWKPYDGMQVPWRPGQQGWMLEYHKTTGRCCYTIVKCANCILTIPMTKRFIKNEVSLADVQVYHSVTEITL
jgi:hypothetical protein